MASRAAVRRYSIVAVNRRLSSGGRGSRERRGEEDNKYLAIVRLWQSKYATK